MRHFRESISDLKSRDYPFPHSLIALGLLEESFYQLEQELTRSEKASAEVRKLLAQRTLEEIYIKLPVLGLIERSGDVVGPVEFHGPFCRMISDVLGESAKLVLSADWDYSPYTYIYPDLFPEHQFVFVAMPYSEAGQVLGLPLAGHELGHNVWSAETLVNIFANTIAQSISQLISDDFKEMYERLESRQGSHESSGDLFGGTPLWHESLKLSIKQCEELFCDFFGMAMFGRSYLCAFEYLTAPWNFPRAPEYPSMADRLAAQVACAKILGIQVPEYYLNSGLSSHVEDDLILQIADVATARQIPKLH